MALRYERVNTCSECGDCSDGTACDPVRQELRNYNGIRYTSDGFDCALPVSIDSFSHCSFKCDYCFSDNLATHRAQTRRKIGRTSLNKVKKLFSGGGGKKFEKMRKALKYNNKNENGYPAPIQLGAICEPMDNIERNQGWLLEFIDLAIEYNQPVRISTKGKLGLIDEYLDAFAQKPELFWIAFSIISPDDELLQEIDKGAPKPSKRIEAMRRFSDIGCKTSLRFRPIIPGLSDSTEEYPEAYKTLIKMCSNAGADAISYETLFLSGMASKDVKKRYEHMERVLDIPLRKIYSQFGKKEPCMRPSYKWTEGIMKAIKQEAKKENMNIGVSDPVWAELGEEICCCGIPEDDPVFGNYEKQTAKKMVVEKPKRITVDEIIPPWAKIVKKDQLCNPGAGPTNLYGRRHTTWADNLRETWNNLEYSRGPTKYFQGAVKPIDKDKNGDLVYKYVGLPESDKDKYPYWNL